MQCSACRAVFSNGLGICPRCKASLPQAAKAEFANSSPKAGKTMPSSVESFAAPMLATNEPGPASESAKPSRLVEFPGTARTPNHPQWRKDLSERVRQIQERRAREAARGPESNQKRRATTVTSTHTEQAKGHPLGLVSVETPTNPLVIAALKRIERARQPMVNASARPRSGGGAATAVARVIEEHYQPEPQLPPALPAEPAICIAEEEPPVITDHVTTQATVVTTTAAAASAPLLPRALNLVVIAPKPQPFIKPQSIETPVQLPEPEIKETVPVAAQEELPMKEEAVVAAVTEAPIATPAAVKATSAADSPPVTVVRPPRRVFDGVVDDAMLARREAIHSSASPVLEQPLFEGADDRASLRSRVVGSLIDLLIVTFLASPFAAIIELTNGNWSDIRVLASMIGIYAVMMFLYLSIATLLAGRTWGMSLVSVHPADVRNGLAPSTKQAVVRSLVYMVSLAAGGLGLLYAFLDAEGRTAHDHLSGTVVLHD